MTTHELIIDVRPDLVKQTLFDEVRRARDIAGRDAQEAIEGGISKQAFLGVESADDIKDTVCGLRDEASKAITFLEWVPFFRAYIAVLIGAYRTLDKLVLSKVCEASQTKAPVVIRNFNN